MGWIITHRAKGISNDEWFQRELLGDRHEIVVSSTIKTVYYAAVRTIETGEVWALVVLTHRAPNSHHNFGWKDMDETCGPCEAQAPAKVLNALTETTNEYALEWRAACRKNLERKARTLAPGTKIRLPKPLTFRFRSEMVDAQEFVYEPDGRRKNIFCTADMHENFRVSLPDWRSYTFEVIA